MNGDRNNDVDGDDDIIKYIDDDDSDDNDEEVNESDVDDDNDDEQTGTSTKLSNGHKRSSFQNEEEDGYVIYPREGARPKRLYVHSSYRPTSTKAWKRWATNVAKTSNLDVVLRNISLSHGFGSILLVFMSCLAMVARGYMSFLALPVWCSIFFFLPSCVTGIRARKHLPNRVNSSSIQYLMTISILSAILSASMSVVYASFIYHDGQLEIKCQPSPSAVTTSSCRKPIYRILINVVIVFLFIVELVDSVFSMGVCCIIRNARQTSSTDEERLILRASTRMSYKRLETEEEDEFLEELGNLSPSPSRSYRRENNNKDRQGGTKYPRSVSAPALLPNRTTQHVTFAD